MTSTSSAVAWWDILGLCKLSHFNYWLPTAWFFSRWPWKPPSETATLLSGRTSVRSEPCLSGWGTSWPIGWRPAAWSGRRSSEGTTAERGCWRRRWVCFHCHCLEWAWLNFSDRVSDDPAHCNDVMRAASCRINQWVDIGQSGVVDSVCVLKVQQPVDDCGLQAFCPGKDKVWRRSSRHPGADSVRFFFT